MALLPVLRASAYDLFCLLDLSVCMQRTDRSAVSRPRKNSLQRKVGAMINVSITGIGGQGSVLAARILAQAAEAKGWQVRSAETIGMAQRGGDVMSHVRMGNEGEAVFSPLPAKGSVDVLIALEPGEAARSLSYLKKNGLLVVASSGIAPVMANFKRQTYHPQALIDDLRASGVKMVVVDDDELVRRLGEPKALNVMMLAYAIIAVNKRPDCIDNALRGAITLEDIESAIPACVKRKLVSMNQKAIKVVSRSPASDLPGTISSNLLVTERASSSVMLMEGSLERETRKEDQQSWSKK